MTEIRDHYVYRAYDANGACLYIGCTKTPRARHRAHMGGLDQRGWFDPFATSWRFTGPLPRSDAYEMERRELVEQRPVFNVQGVPGRGNRRESAIAEYYAKNGRTYPVPREEYFARREARRS